MGNKTVPEVPPKNRYCLYFTFEQVNTSKFESELNKDVLSIITIFPNSLNSVKVLLIWQQIHSQQ